MMFWIPECNMEELEKKLGSISRKCKKYGCDFHYDRLSEEVRTVTDENGGDIYVNFVQVEVSGMAKLNDWEFVATLEHRDGGNIIRGVGNYEVPERYYSCDAVCEHCGTTRNRKDTYIVRNSETGEFKQVGKSCLKDFTNGLSAEFVASYLSFFKEIEELQGFAFGFGRVKRMYKLEDVVLHFTEYIRCFGFAPSSFGADSTNARGSRLFMYLNSLERYGLDEIDEMRSDIERSGFDIDRSVEKSCKVIDFVRNHEEDGNYWHNVKVVFSGEYCRGSDFGIIASAVHCFDKEIEKMERDMAREARKKEEAEISKWVGNVGDKIVIEVNEVKCLTSWETQYGMTWVWKIVDKDGNVFTWKTGNYLEEKTAKIKGTVKALNEYRGVKQTELTRVRVLEEKQEEHKEYRGNVEEALDMLYEAG